MKRRKNWIVGIKVPKALLKCAGKRTYVVQSLKKKTPLRLRVVMVNGAPRKLSIVQDGKVRRVIADHEMVSVKSLSRSRWNPPPAPPYAPSGPKRGLDQGGAGKICNVFFFLSPTREGGKDYMCWFAQISFCDGKVTYRKIICHLLRSNGGRSMPEP